MTETTRPGTVMGTFGYMSPEQVSGEPVDAPSDIFSLGCVLYEIVSRELPFGGEDVVGKIAAILRDEPAPLAGKVKRVPEDLERVIRHCLEKRPVERFQSARDLAFDLKALLSGGGTLRPAWALPMLRIHPAVWIARPRWSRSSPCGPRIASSFRSRAGTA